MTKAIYKYSEYFGRMGDLEGIFVADKEQAERLIAASADVYLGEVLGKHSEVYATIDAKTTKMVSDNTFDIAVLERLGLTSVGTDPVARALEIEAEEADNGESR